MLQVKQMMTEELEEMAENAMRFLKNHEAHVNSLLEGAQLAVPPSGSDIYRPELWKPCHWLWFENWIHEQGKAFLKEFN